MKRVINIILMIIAAICTVVLFLGGEFSLAVESLFCLAIIWNLDSIYEEVKFLKYK